jgi:hypothetical protein
MLFEKKSGAKHYADLTTLTFGFAKSGKTSLHVAYEKISEKPPLLIMTEDGLGSLEAYIVRVTTWNGFVKLLDKLDREKNQLIEQYGCLVVDLVGEIDAMAAQYVCEVNGKESLDEIGHGKGYFLQASLFKQAIQNILSLGLPVKFIAHAKDKRVGNAGDGATLFEPDISKQAKQYILGKCDAIGFIEPSNNKGDNYLNFNSPLAPDTGSRFPQLIKSFKLNHSDLSKTLLDIDAAFYEKESE